MTNLTYDEQQAIRCFSEHEITRAAKALENAKEKAKEKYELHREDLSSINWTPYHYAQIAASIRFLEACSKTKTISEQSVYATRLAIQKHFKMPSYDGVFSGKDFYACRAAVVVAIVECGYDLARNKINISAKSLKDAINNPKCLEFQV